MKRAFPESPPAGAERPIVLVVGALADRVDDSVCLGTTLIARLSGTAALRACSESADSDRIEAVFCDSNLPDMSGVGLLDRAARLLPRAARVLLVTHGNVEEEAPEAAVSQLVTDVWRRPERPTALVRRFQRERRALVRHRRLQDELDALSDALERLRARYEDTRQMRDRLVESMGALTDTRACARWSRDFRELTELREQGCPCHLRPLAAQELLSELVRIADSDGAALRPGPLRLRFDPALLREIFERTAIGFKEFAVPRTRPRFTVVVCAHSVEWEMSVHLARYMEIEGLLDPMLGAGTRPALDLPIAAALADVHGAPLRLEVTEGKLRAKMVLERLENARGTMPLTPAKGRLEVPALDRSL